MSKRRVIVLGVPSLGTVSIYWTAAYSNIGPPLNCNLHKTFVCNRPVAEARNEIVADTLRRWKDDKKTEPSHIFFLDDDVLCRRFAIVQLLNRHAPVVSGVYFSRAEASEPLVFAARGAGSMPFIPDQFLQVWGHGMGLTLIEVDVFRRMQHELDLGTDDCGNPAWFRTLHNEPAEDEDGDRYYCSQTEDLYFCTQLDKLNIPRFVDTTQAAFGWHFDRETCKAYPEKQWKDWNETQKCTWETANGPVIWSK